MTPIIVKYMKYLGTICGALASPMIPIVGIFVVYCIVDTVHTFGTPALAGLAAIAFGGRVLLRKFWMPPQDDAI